MMRQKRLVFNEKACMGCCACEIACKMENQLPKGIRFIVMKQREEETRSGQRLKFRLDRCRHCKDAPCVRRCPVKAITQREDGIVIVREEDCIGCGTCLDACFYGVPVLEKSDSGRKVMRKCNMCYQRLDLGLVPACVNACPAGAIRIEEK